MNYRTEQFRSRADRQKEADLCALYKDVQLPAVKASEAIHSRADKTLNQGYLPKSGE